jgi:hypothetical protein
MSLTELYSIEAEFNEKRKEYISLMDSIKHTCLGEKKSSDVCLKASRLNADMQTCLIKLSNLSVKYPPANKPIQTQQKNLLKLSDTLQHDLNAIKTDDKINEDLSLTNLMSKQNSLAWGIATIFILSLVIYHYKKI